MFRFSFLLLSLFALEAHGQSACTMCADVDLQETYEAQVSRMQTNMTCADVQAQITALDTTDDDTACLDLQLTNYQIGCCAKPPFLHCSICPDGSEKVRSNMIPIGSGNDPTCAEGQFRENLFLAPFEIGTCEDTFLRRSAHYCGCQGVEQECTLCPNGESPERTDNELVFAFNTPCAGVEWIFSLFDEQSCTDVPLTYGFDAAAFCECPGYEPEYDYDCTLCKEGDVVSDRSLVWSDTVFGSWSCGQAEDFAQYFLREGTCSSLLDAAREQCECVKDGAFSLSLVVSFMMAGGLVIQNLFL